MSELRQRMIDQMTLRGFSPRTHESYLEAVTGLARYYKQSPDQLSAEQVRQYLL
jgi:integrase/recombinase XerD